MGTFLDTRRDYERISNERDRRGGSSQAVLPAMLRRGQQHVALYSATASLGGRGVRAVCCTKFGLRAITQSMAARARPRGIHVAHVIVDGAVEIEAWRARGAKSMLVPDDVAKLFPGACGRESAWTLRARLRPFDEKF